MKKLYPLAIIMILSAILILALMPGCDELVTTENYYYDTLRIDGTVHEADTTCGICHNDDTDSITIAKRQWEFSRHGIGNLTDYDYLGENTTVCGPQCHTKEGYVQYLADSTTGTVYFPTEIGCFTCHSPHGNKDFSLRDETNICHHCHQQRLEAPPAGLIDVAISTNYGPHFSTESGMVLGTGGYQSPLFSYNTSLHASEGFNSCFTCHMDTADVFTLGGHSLNITFGSEQMTAGCNIDRCHAGNVTNIYSHDPLQDDLPIILEQLKDSLISANLLTAEGIPVARSITGDSLVSDSAGALFNYLFVSGDSSFGVHNLPYARDLVTASLNFLSDRFTLTIVNASSDSGTVTLNPTGGSYIKGTIVEIQATANASYVFDTWAGDNTSSNNPVNILMDKDKTITVNFVAE